RSPRDWSSDVCSSALHRPPHAHRLVRLAGVGHEQMLEDRLRGAGDLLVGDRDVLVAHGWLLPQGSWFGVDGGRGWPGELRYNVVVGGAGAGTWGVRGW